MGKDENRTENSENFEEFCSFTESRRQQHLKFKALPFSEKIRIICNMQKTKDLIQNAKVLRPDTSFEEKKQD